MSLPPALPPVAMRIEAQRVYGEDQHGYDAGRPDHPEAVFALLASRSGLRRRGLPDPDEPPLIIDLDDHAAI